ncbi:MAG: CDP-diacylglycerol--serine O-phosphatidyltransferase [Candidatus Oxydemutatoraceae bacterium WSBS_2016_MAG_OTU14]
MMEKKRYRGIYLLPNVITLSSLFAGFYAIINAIQGNLEWSIWLVLLCVILDGIDGPVARMLKIESHFGAELDSLTDAIAFGVAPAVITYQWLMLGFVNTETWARAVWLITSFYVACTVLRLARFNVQTAIVDKGIFQGLPSPAAAALTVSFIWVVKDLLSFVDIKMWVLGVSLLMLILLSIAMVSRCSYYSFKKTDLSSKVSFLALFVVAAVLTVAAIDFPWFLFGVTFIYFLSGPIIYLIRSLRKRYDSKHRATARKRLF